LDGRIALPADSRDREHERDLTTAAVDALAASRADGHLGSPGEIAPAVARMATYRSFRWSVRW
jgi:hypothetical protein